MRRACVFFRKQNAEILRSQTKKPFNFSAAWGIAVIHRALFLHRVQRQHCESWDPDGTGSPWISRCGAQIISCAFSLNRDDVLQFEVARKAERLPFRSAAKTAANPIRERSGSCVFTVAVPETDLISDKKHGKDATGKVAVKNLGTRG